MTKEQLKEFKQALTNYYNEVVTPLSNFSEQPYIIAIEVAVQNMAFQGTNCANYNHTSELINIAKAEKFIQGVNGYYDNHFTNMIVEEIEQLKMGILMG